jgi:hypothetical protein
MKIRYIIFPIAALFLMFLTGCPTSVASVNSTTYTKSYIPNSDDISKAKAYVELIYPQIKAAYDYAYGKYGNSPYPPVSSSSSSTSSSSSSSSMDSYYSSSASATCTISFNYTPVYASSSSVSSGSSSSAAPTSRILAVNSISFVKVQDSTGKITLSGPAGFTPSTTNCTYDESKATYTISMNLTNFTVGDTNVYSSSSSSVVPYYSVLGSVVLNGATKKYYLTFTLYGNVWSLMY